MARILPVGEMYNIKIFPQFIVPNKTNDQDSDLVAELLNVKIESGAKFVNFSAYDYKSSPFKTEHIITYPIDWVTRYVQNQYMEIDPIITHDYRSVLYLDWSEAFSLRKTADLFEQFAEHGLGNNGISSVHHINANVYGVTHFSYEHDDETWFDFRNSKMETLRLLGAALSRRYMQIYKKEPMHEYKLTKRESNCLYWVALGKTDEEISEVMKIGKWTVVGHLKSAKFKLGTANRASAVAKAISLGIIEI
ncbi:MAG: autoinducer binding domain-containing protein [Pseudomonadota bacterium]